MGQFPAILLISRTGQKQKMKSGLCFLRAAFLRLGLAFGDAPVRRARLRGALRRDEGDRRRALDFFFGLRLAIPGTNGA